MIALAVADWPLSRRLLAEGKLHVDFLESPGFLAEHSVAQFPTQRFLLHNSVDDWSLGHPEALAQEQVLPRTLHLLDVTQAPWFSVHLGFSAATVVFETWNMPRSAVIGREQLFATICANVHALAEALPVPLILENLDYCSGGAYEHICEPEFIRAVLEATGAGLLLDLAHARVSAARMGQPIERYLAGLPLDRVLQMHVSGPRPRDGVLADAHEPMLEVDYDLLRHVLSLTQPRAVSLEYSRDETALLEQVQRLADILHAPQGSNPVPSYERYADHAAAE